MSRPVYKIHQGTKNQAKRLGVIVKPSITGNFKIDVYSKDGKLICRIGDINHKDYWLYLDRYGKKYAQERQALYLKRSGNYTTDRGRYARLLLWMDEF
jgi:hypothetical protein